jgi:hypothetical protein
MSLEAKVGALEAQYADLKDDTRYIREKLDVIVPQLAQLPTFVHLSQVKERVTQLETVNVERRGAWKTVIAVASMAGAGLGFLLDKFWDKLAN